MKIYRVGGSIRDELLGLTAHDKDYVVVGSNPEEMLKLGFKPVGRDFPVFIHPKTRDEYALARTERKIAKGYTGFEFNTSTTVSLEDDLSRRDITINAIAIDETNSQIIDPFHGVDDLQKGVIRHISGAFSEDPLRVLRVARFSARFNFKVANETKTLMKQIAKSNELQTLSKERIWNEFQKAISTKNPEIFFEILYETEALHVICPEIAELINKNHLVLLNHLKNAVVEKFIDIELFALITYLVSSYTTYISIDSLIPPNKFLGLAQLIIKAYPQITQLDSLAYDQIVTLIKIIDPLRHKNRLNSFIKIISFLASKSENNSSNKVINNIKNLLIIVEMFKKIEYTILTQNPEQIEQHIYAKKIGIITQVLSNNEVKS